jgi:uncharacterized protein YjiS (DUF1127 family)
MTTITATSELSTRSATLAQVAVRALARGFVAWRRQRARRIAMLSLLDMDAHRLDDLGISLDNVRDAINAR